MANGSFIFVSVKLFLLIFAFAFACYHMYSTYLQYCLYQPENLIVINDYVRRELRVPTYTCTRYPLHVTLKEFIIFFRADREMFNSYFPPFHYVRT